MKFLLKTALILGFGYLAGLYLPFWSLVAIAFVIGGMIRTTAVSSFLAGFTAIFILWFCLAWLIDHETRSILTTRVASIFSVSNIVLMLITGAIGGLASGFAAASGTLFINLFRKKRVRKYY